MTNKRPDVLEDARDITIVAHSQKDTYVFAAKTSLAFQRQTFDKTFSDLDDRRAVQFSGPWQFNNETGIIGTSMYLGLRFDKLALRPLGLWLPGLEEGKTLDEQGKLDDLVSHRCAGIVLINSQDPNKNHAGSLSTLANGLGLELPLVAPFRSFDYVLKDWKVNLSFVQNPTGIISGVEAAKQIKALRGPGNSGVYSFSRTGISKWNKDAALHYSSFHGRTGDWVCGETTRENLMQAYNALSERNYRDKIKAIQTEQSINESKFLALLN